eukprot:90768-Pyramimonas_sp.AAC.1
MAAPARHRSARQGRGRQIRRPKTRHLLLPHPRPRGRLGVLGRLGQADLLLSSPAGGFLDQAVQGLDV